jgi:hypothetical protein
MEAADHTLTVGLNAVILTADPKHPQVLIVPHDGSDVGLPFGPFDPAKHRTFEIGLRRFVAQQARFELGYVEQLYTFGDRGREAPLAELSGAEDSRIVSVSYLGLTADAAPLPEGGGQWRDVYRFFPWEDWRDGRPELIDTTILPKLDIWASESDQGPRQDRIRQSFGRDRASWNEERVLDRFELLYEAGLLAEAARAGRVTSPSSEAYISKARRPAMGQTLASDHRRILATGFSRLRGKIKYRPVVFELMPDLFTLSHLQQVVEAIIGYRLHKQNFRRALDRTGFVEGTGKMESQTGGRPAELYRYRREALAGLPALGLATPKLKEL